MRRRAASFFAAPLALGAAVLVASRVTYEGWAEFPPTSSALRLLYLVVLGAPAVALVVAAPGRSRSVAAGLVGAALGAALAWWPLDTALIRQVESGAARSLWRAGAVVFLAVVAVLMERACRPAAEPAPRALHRFRDDLGPAFALGLCVAIGAPSLIFSASAKLAELMFSIGFAWAGLLVLAVVLPGFTVAGAAIVVVCGYAAAWLGAYFYAEPRTASLALALAAPLLIGLASRSPRVPPASDSVRRSSGPAGWKRWLVSCVIAVVVCGAAAGLAARAYFATPDDAASMAR